MNKKRPDGLMDWILTGIFAALAARGTKKIITSDRDNDQQEHSDSHQDNKKSDSGFHFGGWNAFYLLITAIIAFICYFGHLDHITENNSEVGMLRILGIMAGMSLLLMVHSRLLNPKDRTSIHILLVCIYWVAAISFRSGYFPAEDGNISGLVAIVITSTAVLWSVVLPCYIIFNPLISALTRRQ